jgi:hypothetical protein
MSLVSAVACQSGRGNEPLSTTTDSAGITIVTNFGPEWGEGEGWRLTPTLDLGGVADPGPEEFSRIAAIRRLGSGLIVVAEAAALELRFFDLSGAHVRTVGRKGQGPGEFESISWLAPLGDDSLVVFGGRAARYSVFDTAGRFGRSWRLEQHDSVGYPGGVGLFQDGSVLARTRPTRVGTLANGMWSEPLYFHRYGRDRRFIADIAESVSSETFVAVRERGYTMLGVPFGRMSYSVAIGRTLLIAVSDVPEFRLYPTDGAAARIVRWPAKAIPLTAEEWDRQIGVVTDHPRMSDDIRALYRRVPRKTAMPLFDHITAADGGTIWIRRFAAPEDTISTFLVFDGRGRWLGEVDGPGGFRPRHIGNDFVLGDWFDDDDVPHVLMYRLIK